MWIQKLGVESPNHGWYGRRGLNLDVTHLILDDACGLKAYFPNKTKHSESLVGFIIIIIIIVFSFYFIFDHTRRCIRHSHKKETDPSISLLKDLPTIESMTSSNSSWLWNLLWPNQLHFCHAKSILTCVPSWDFIRFKISKRIGYTLHAILIYATPILIFLACLLQLLGSGRHSHQ